MRCFIKRTVGHFGKYPCFLAYPHPDEKITISFTMLYVSQWWVELNANARKVTIKVFVGIHWRSRISGQLFYLEYKNQNKYNNYVVSVLEVAGLVCSLFTRLHRKAKHMKISKTEYLLTILST